MLWQHSSFLNDRVREAAKWLQAAFFGGRPFTKLHLAHVTVGMRAKRTRRWLIAKSTFQLSGKQITFAACTRACTLTPGVPTPRLH